MKRLRQMGTNFDITGHAATDMGTKKQIMSDSN